MKINNSNLLHTIDKSVIVVSTISVIQKISETTILIWFNSDKELRFQLTSAEEANKQLTELSDKILYVQTLKQI